MSSVVMVAGAIALRSTANSIEARPSRAKFEPTHGCYIGASIDYELKRTGKFTHIKGGMGFITVKGKTTPVVVGDTDIPETVPISAEDFARLVGKTHAIFFSYFRYGASERVLREFLAKMKQGNRSAQIALEPSSLAQVKNDKTLDRLAAILKESGVPVFLRFASEMNGNWVLYTGNPALYREKFRLVSRVMHEKAPNVAMVWCPSATPQGPIKAYFPGDDAVDWVGVDFYSVAHPRTAAPDPAASLDFVYRTYSAKHPIMICEWAASHRSKVDQVERTDFATRQISRLYAALPKRYPRVKAVNWLCLNAIEHMSTGTLPNDYSLLDNEQVRAAYSKAIRSQYYLTDVVR